MRLIFFLAIFCLAAACTEGQNLVPNPDFEDYIECPDFFFINGNNDETNINNTNDIENEIEAAERRQKQFEEDLNDCLSRIHIVQMEDDGSTGWVPFLEALKHRLQQRRQQQQQQQQYNEDDDINNISTSTSLSPFTNKTPTLLLWDGFLADIQEGDEANTREILQQMTRLLQQESDNLWWVLTTTTTTE